MLKKIVFIVFIAIVGFVGFLTYSVQTAIDNKQRLDHVKIIYFPTLERIDANIVRLDKVKELFIQSAMTEDEDLIDSAKEFIDNADEVFEQLKDINQLTQADVISLQKNFKKYFDLGRTSILSMQGAEMNSPEFKAKIKKMNNALEHLNMQLKNFRESSYDDFTSTLIGANKAADISLYVGIVVGVVNLFFLGVLTYFMTNNIKMMAVIEEQNANLEKRVAERTTQLAQKTNDMLTMLHNMKQGVFTVMAENKIHPEYSSYLETILGTVDIARRDVMELIFEKSDAGSDIINQVGASLFAIINEDEMAFDFNSHLLVSEIQLTGVDDQIKILQFDWVPILNQDDVVEKLLVITQDVTEVRKLAREAEKQRKELNIISQILKISQEKFNEFISTAYAYIDDNLKLITATTEKDLEIVTALFRNMHTIKGNARTYEFVHLTDIIHETEQTYDDFRKNETSVWNQQRLLEELDMAKAAIEEYDMINQDKLGRKGRAGDLLTSRGVFISSQALNSLIGLAKHMQASETGQESAINEIYTELLQVGKIPLLRLASGAIDSVCSLSKELGKPEPTLKLYDKNIAFSNDIAEPLKSSFMHIVRNCVDHGIESKEDRIAAGKLEAGTIIFEIIDKVNHFHFCNNLATNLSFVYEHSKLRWLQNQINIFLHCLFS